MTKNAFISAFCDVACEMCFVIWERMPSVKAALENFCVPVTESGSGAPTPDTVYSSVKTMLASSANTHVNH